MPVVTKPNLIYCGQLASCLPDSVTGFDTWNPVVPRVRVTPCPIWDMDVASCSDDGNPLVTASPDTSAETTVEVVTEATTEVTLEVTQDVTQDVTVESGVETIETIVSVEDASSNEAPSKAKRVRRRKLVSEASGEQEREANALDTSAIVAQQSSLTCSKIGESCSSPETVGDVAVDEIVQSAVLDGDTPRQRKRKEGVQCRKRG